MSKRKKWNHSAIRELEQVPADWRFLFTTAFRLMWNIQGANFSEIIRSLVLDAGIPPLDLYVQKLPNVVFHDKVGCFFSEHNLISCKSCTESLLPEDFWILFAYILLFVTQHMRDKLPSSAVTLTAFTTTKPEKLLLYLKKEHIRYTALDDAIFRLNYMGYNMQIVVSTALEDPFFTPIRLLRGDLDEKDLSELHAYMEQIEQAGVEEARREAGLLVRGLAEHNQTLFLREAQARSMEFWSKVVYEQYGEVLRPKDQEISEQRQEIAELKQTISDQKQEISDQEQIIAGQKREIAKLNSEKLECARQMIRLGMKASDIIRCTKFSLSRLTRLARSMGTTLVTGS